MTPDDTKLDVPLGPGNPLHHQTVNNQCTPLFKEKKGGMRKRNIRWSAVIPPGPLHHLPSPALCAYGGFGPDAQAQLLCHACDH